MAKMTHPDSPLTVEAEPERQAMYLSAGWRLKAAPNKTTVAAPTDGK
jgi:hypothetical protein